MSTIEAFVMASVGLIFFQIFVALCFVLDTLILDKHFTKKLREKLGVNK